MKHSRVSCRAFILPDAMIGLMIIGSLGVILAVAIGSEHAAEQTLADYRAATRSAERVLLSLQLHQSVPPFAEGSVEVHAISGDAPAGFSWTTVDTSINGRHATLVGLVPSTGAKP